MRSLVIILILIAYRSVGTSPEPQEVGGGIFVAPERNFPPVLATPETPARTVFLRQPLDLSTKRVVDRLQSHFQVSSWTWLQAKVLELSGSASKFVTYQDFLAGPVEWPAL